MSSIQNLNKAIEQHYIKEKIKMLITFLKDVNLSCNNLNELDGMMLYRNTLLSDEKYEEVKKKIPELKTLFSSSYMTSLQSNAEQEQRWPLLNLVRQVLRTCNYKLVPKRLSDGYSAEGRKKYKRIFIIEKMKLGTNEIGTNEIGTNEIGTNEYQDSVTKEK
jgi:hypothetical protein